MKGDETSLRTKAIIVLFHPQKENLQSIFYYPAYRCSHDQVTFQGPTALKKKYMKPKPLVLPTTSSMSMFNG